MRRRERQTDGAASLGARRDRSQYTAEVLQLAGLLYSFERLELYSLFIMETISSHTLTHDDSQSDPFSHLYSTVPLLNPAVSAREAVMRISGTRGNPRTSAQSGEVGVPRHLLTCKPQPSIQIPFFDQNMILVLSILIF
jgi:hypothetical protein